MKYNKNLDKIDVYKNSYRDEIEDLHDYAYYKLDWNEASNVPTPLVQERLVDYIPLRFPC